ncbi:MAG: aminopeptidase N [Gammaproteobacteria bacterium]
MSSEHPKVHYLNAYQPSDFLIDAVYLHFALEDTATRVKAILDMRRNPLSKDLRAPLVLDGEALKLITVTIDGVELAKSAYSLDDKHLTIRQVPERFKLETEVEINPAANKKLSGLYKSGDIFCTQCESQGFRRITYYLDRPDVLAQFTTGITADPTRYPVLLANGNLTESHLLDNGKQWVKWVDPTLKPCYLFALVAGNLDVLEDVFITQSERKIQLAIYVEPGKLPQATHAMHSLKLAMAWDEKAYGREYDLQNYMIVGVGDFNFGAMENKGLNIFNDKYILAQQETATDEDFIDVMSVIAHEYFHNWSGNRVTVRDWFQITLKEGLTVFREHQFTAEKTSPTVKRIQEAKLIRNQQFSQDAGPMAHPVYPDSYIQINNFYTVTVYEKGAEIIRMLHTLLGATAFRKAMDYYFSRNDGQAVSVEEFVRAMEITSGKDLQQFRRWYKQAGTPVVMIKDEYNAQTQTYTLTVTQACPPTPGQPDKEPFHIPLAVGLLDENGNALPLQFSLEQTAVTGTEILSVTQPVQSFHFFNVTSRPVPSLLRDFSAPVKLQFDYTEENLLLLARHDTDLFNRWDACQQLALRILLRLIANYEAELELVTPYAYLTLLSEILADESLDPALKAEMLVPPAESYLIEQMPVANVDAIHAVREWLRKHIAATLKTAFLNYYQQQQVEIPYAVDAQAVGRRRLKNLALGYLALLADESVFELCTKQFNHANNMTEVMGALLALNDIDCPTRQQMLAAFYHKWQKDNLVVDKWLRLQAQSTLPDTLSVVKSLIQQPSFDLKNPNRVRALIGGFCSGNPVRFHTLSGEGYEFLAHYVLEIDQFNPQLAARIIEPLTLWKKFDATRQQLMRAQLEKILLQPKLSSDVYEIVTKSLVLE